jgi:hypothetical protein
LAELTTIFNWGAGVAVGVIGVVSGSAVVGAGVDPAGGRVGVISAVVDKSSVPARVGVKSGAEVDSDPMTAAGSFSGSKRTTTAAKKPPAAIINMSNTTPTIMIRRKHPELPFSGSPTWVMMFCHSSFAAEYPVRAG